MKKKTNKKIKKETRRNKQTQLNKEITLVLKILNKIFQEQKIRNYLNNHQHNLFKSTLFRFRYKSNINKCP